MDKKFSNLEPYTAPGDYNVPKLMGNKSIIVSSMKTPPHYTFTKSGVLDPHYQTLNQSNPQFYKYEGLNSSN